MPKVTLRQATEYDWDLLSAVQESCMREYAEQTWAKWITEPRNNFRPEIHQVIQCDGDNIGCIALIDEPDALTLEKLYIVGSANFSTNGLNVEDDEFAAWLETGYETRDAHDLGRMRGWFRRQWARAEAITDSLMLLARKNWARRVKSRIPFASRNSLLSMSAAALRGRDIHLAFWRDRLSPKAERIVDARKEERANATGSSSAGNCTAFEDWKRIAIGQTVISVQVGERGGVAIDGPYLLDEKIKKVCARSPERPNDDDPHRRQGERNLRHAVRPSRTLGTRQQASRMGIAPHRRAVNVCSAGRDYQQPMNPDSRAAVARDNANATNHRSWRFTKVAGSEPYWDYRDAS